jgi:hypothetical protein
MRYMRYYAAANTPEALENAGSPKSKELPRLRDLNGELSPRTFGDATQPRQPTVLGSWRDETAVAAQPMVLSDLLRTSIKV